MNTVTIRSFRLSDTASCIQLFQETVIAIGSRYYSDEQVKIWVSHTDYEYWENKLKSRITFVAEIDAKMVGFADITHEGLLDHMYIHQDYQGRGISYALYKQIESAARHLNLSKIITHASIMAMPIAKRIGFKVIETEKITKNKVEFIRYLMEKTL